MVTYEIRAARVFLNGTRFAKTYNTATMNRLQAAGRAIDRSQMLKFTGVSRSAAHTSGRNARYVAATFPIATPRAPHITPTLTAAAKVTESRIPSTAYRPVFPRDII